MSDFMPHHKGFVGKIGTIGKKVSPVLSRMLTHPSAATAVRYASIYLDVIQGKGSGAGWDLEGETKTAQAFIRAPFPIIFDVGAHKGSWSQTIIDMFGKNCHIYQFEPLHYNLDHIKNRVITNSTLIPRAVSDTPGTASFYSTKKASSTSSLYKRRESIFEDHEYESSTVEVTTIDNVIDELGIETVHFMKMDIEGHELAALRGSIKALKNHKIECLTFEFGSGNINSRTFFHDFWDLLTPLGYSIWRICPGGVLLPIRRYYEDLEYFRNVSNYVAALEAPYVP